MTQVRHRGYTTAAVLAVFLNGGVIGLLPFDPVVPAAVVVAVASLLAVKKWGVPPTVLWPLGVFATFWAALLWSPLNTDYAVEKVTILFTATLVAAVAPTLLIRRQEQLWVLIYGLAAIGAVGAAFTFYGGPNPIHGTLESFGSNPIWESRAIGVTVLVCAWFALHRGWLIAAGLFAVGATAMIALGARGPLLAAGVSGVILLLLFLQRSDRGASVRKKVVVVSLGVAILVVAGGAILVPSASLDRFTVVDAEHNLGPDPEIQTLLFRWWWYQDAAEAGAEQPMGRGWGSWTGLMPAAHKYPEANYPHNVVLEVLVEAGLPAAIGLVGLVLGGLWRLWRLRELEMAQLVLGLYIFAVLAAMWSGDINNRLLFGMAAVALLPRAVFVSSPHEAAGQEGREPGRGRTPGRKLAR